MGNNTPNPNPGQAKLCLDCRNCISHYNAHDFRCMKVPTKRRFNLERLVVGNARMNGMGDALCMNARSKRGACGPEGRLWEPKPEEWQDAIKWHKHLSESIVRAQHKRHGEFIVRIDSGLYYPTPGTIADGTQHSKTDPI